MNTSRTAQRLKEIRTSTGLSIRELAFELGMEKGKYEHYEARYKKPYLPADLAADIARILVPRGVPREAIMALAGPLEDAEAMDEMSLGRRYGQLSQRRQRMMREFLEELEAAERGSQQAHTAKDDAQG